MKYEQFNGISNYSYFSLQHLSYEETLRELGQLRLKKRTQEDLISVYIYLIKRYEVCRARLFSVISSEWTRGKRDKLKYFENSFKLKNKLFYYETC